CWFPWGRVCGWCGGVWSTRLADIQAGYLRVGGDRDYHRTFAARDRARRCSVSRPHPRATAGKRYGGARLSVAWRGAGGDSVGGGRHRGGGGSLRRGGARVGGVGFAGLGAGVAGAWDWWYAPVHAAVGDGFRARLDEGPFRAQKRAPTALWGPLLFGIFSSTPLVPARFQASHVIAHSFLAFAGCGLRPDHNASVHQAHGPGTAGRVCIQPH